MIKIDICSYCNQDYYDYYLHLTQANRLMCVDCYHNDVPAIKVGA